MAEPTTYTADNNGRIISLINGHRPDQSRFWIYIAVVPSKYNDFMSAQAQGKLDLYNLKPYGEVVFFGDGDLPPQDITAKVAAIYQADPANMFQSEGKDLLREVEQKVAAMNEQEAKLNKPSTSDTDKLGLFSPPVQQNESPPLGFDIPKDKPAGGSLFDKLKKPD